MTVEKLQKVAMSMVEPKYKAKWLYWWNYFANVQIGNKFSSESLVKSAMLEAWLSKASLWAHVQ